MQMKASSIHLPLPYQYGVEGSKDHAQLNWIWIKLHISSWVKGITIKCGMACFLQGHKEEKQLRAGIARKSIREVDKAEECITATTTYRSKYILFLCRIKQAYEDLKVLLKWLMMHSPWWETGFTVIYQQKQWPRWQEALLQAQQDTDGVWEWNRSKPVPSPFPTHQYYCPRWDLTITKVNPELPLAWKLLINKHKLWLLQPNHLALNFISVH